METEEKIIQRGEKVLALKERQVAGSQKAFEDIHEEITAKHAELEALYLKSFKVTQDQMKLESEAADLELALEIAKDDYDTDDEEGQATKRLALRDIISKTSPGLGALSSGF